MLSTVVSCPGKALIAGGYLVLSPDNYGVVIATASRFYTCVQLGNGPLAISVVSPQFTDGLWHYTVNVDAENDICTVEQSDKQKPANKFVQLALQGALQISAAKMGLKALQQKLSQGLKITIVGDNDFYSQDRSSVSTTPFNPLNYKISEVHKTGLGSSAAMVTSLVSAIVLHLVSEQPVTQAHLQENQDLLHNTSQYVHSLAQGKIGSGFDVSSAVYGSQTYQRFDSYCLEELLSESSTTKRNSHILAALDPNTENSLWIDAAYKVRINQVHLPMHTTLLLADVDTGSNTPSMVSSVLKWKKADAGAADVWTKIAFANEAMLKAMMHLSELYAQDATSYQTAVTELSSLSAKEWTNRTDVFSIAFNDLSAAIQCVRTRMKNMGELADVPIEPDEQTRLLDALQSQCSGVVGGGVPGAGGYDAIWVLVLSPDVNEPSTSEQQVRQTLLDWKEMSVRPLSEAASVKGSLPNSNSAQLVGMQVHSIEDVSGLERLL